MFVIGNVRQITFKRYKAGQDVTQILQFMMIIIITILIMMNFVMQQVLTGCYHRSLLCALFLYLVYCAVNRYQMALESGMCTPQKINWLTFE